MTYLIRGNAFNEYMSRYAIVGEAEIAWTKHKHKATVFLSEAEAWAVINNTDRMSKHRTKKRMTVIPYVPDVPL